MKKVIAGLVKMLLILDTKFEDLNAMWFQQKLMQSNLDVFFGQILTSSYISAEVIDEKVMCFALIYDNLMRFSSTQSFRDGLLNHVKQGTNPILDRIENCLLMPLSL